MQKITTKNWIARMTQDMRLQALSARTVEGYLLAVRLFFERTGTTPSTATEDHVRDYLTHLSEERNQKPSSIAIAKYALRFFFAVTMRRDYEVFSMVRIRTSRALPTVLSREEVHRAPGAIEHPVRRIALTTIYALGLRLGEGLALEAGHIESDRKIVMVRSGKGAKDRAVPLPRPLLVHLRRYWKHDRPTSSGMRMFVNAKGEPLHETTLQKTFKAARENAKIERHATIHTLRHSYATHLIEAGISIRAIQDILGHSSLKTTEVYMHVTTPGRDRVQEVVDALMKDL